jgi:hypothetical protein
VASGRDQDRTGDTRIFSPLLYQLSYPTDGFQQLNKRKEPSQFPKKRRLAAINCSRGRNEARLTGLFVDISGRVSEARWAGSQLFFLVMKVSPEAVAIPERKGWKNRCLVCWIVTQLSPALFNFLEWRAPRARKNLGSMEQCFRAEAGEHRLLARALFHECSIELARRDPRDF